MGRRNVWVTGALVCMTLSVGVGACGEDEKSDTPNEILIGGTVSKVGAFAASAAPFDLLGEAWANEINAEGGIYLKKYDKKLPVRFISYDDESVGAKVRELYTKLVNDDKVDFLIGPYSSPLNIQAQDVSRELEIPLLMVEANSNALYKPGNKWSFGVLESGVTWAHPYFDMLKANTDAHTVVMVAEDHPHTSEVFTGAVDYATSLGFEIVFQQIVKTAAEVTYDNIPNNADVIFLSAWQPFSVPFVQELKTRGITSKALHVTHHGKTGFGTPLGADADHVTGEVYWLPSMTDFTHVDRFTTIQERAQVAVANYPWAAIRMFAYDGIEAALTLAGSVDREDVRKAFRDVSYESIRGTINFDDDTGIGTMGPVPSQYQDSDLVLIWPTELKNAAFVYPR